MTDPRMEDIDLGFGEPSHTPLADEVDEMWEEMRLNGSALGAIQAAIDATRGNVMGYPLALERIEKVILNWRQHDAA